MPLQPSEVSEIADEVAKFIESHQLRFERGPPRKYFSSLGFLCDALTLPIVPQDKRPTVVRLKNYCNLWNILVDDEIDREGRRSQLDESMLLLLEHSRGKTGPYEGSSAAARTLDLVLQEVARLPTRPSRTLQHEVFHFDLLEEMNGFRYEYCSNKMTGAANELEYTKYSTITASLKHFLDLDCLFAESELDAADYRQLRMAYEHLAVAVKLASDLGSLKRELVEENNLNLVRILGLESGVPFEQRVASDVEYEAFLPRLRPAVNEVHRRSKAQLDSALARLAQVRGVDTRGLQKAASGVVDTYFKGFFALKGDPFFQKVFQD